jgi:hypothetical protein
VRAAFAAANPGYDLSWHAPLGRLAAQDDPLVVFVQGGEALVTVERGGAIERCDPPLTTGDVILLRPGESAVSGGDLSALAFRVPAALPAELPCFVRPDWDANITDTPGGCAEETGAYRRILLTWLTTNGPYVYHALNAHRVRISDSFTHYHPRDGGFAELYLVQMAGPEARLLTSEHVAAIEAQDVDAERAAELFESRALAAGDLVYLPRGIAHRGLGGALVQVITLPGFRPGAEIGLDHHLRAIAERVDVPVPFHAAASASPVVR